MCSSEVFMLLIYYYVIKFIFIPMADLNSTFSMVTNLHFSQRKNCLQHGHERIYTYHVYCNMYASQPRV